MKKALATSIDINYQLLLYYIDKLKDSFKVYCYENVQKYEECSVNSALSAFLDIDDFYTVVLYERTNAVKFLLGLSLSNEHLLAAFIVNCLLEKDNNSVLLFF